MELKLILFWYTVTCCLVISAASQDDFSVTIIPESTTATATLQQVYGCYYNVSPTVQHLKVQWYKYAGDQTSPSLVLTAERDLDGTNNSTEPGPGYDGERLYLNPRILPLSTFHAILFVHLRLEDAGQYYCRVSYKDSNDELKSGQSPLARMAVIVRPAPFLKIYAINEEGNATKDISEGDTGYAECRSASQLPPDDDEVKFTMYNGTQSIQCFMQIDPDVCRVQVTFGCHDHNVSWGCRALWNGTSYSAYERVLDVKCDPVIHGYTGPLHEGDDLTLACTAENQPDAHVVWTFSTNGRSLGEVAEGPTYTKQGVEMSDAGDYMCTAVTDGHMKNVTITVEVLEMENTTTAPMTTTDIGNETSGVSSSMMKDVWWKVWCCFVSLWLYRALCFNNEN